MELTTSSVVTVVLEFLFFTFGSVFSWFCIYKLFKWVYHLFVPASAKPKSDPNLFYTSDGKPMRRAPWNGRLYEDMDEYEHDREIAEIEYQKGYSEGRAVGRISKY